MTDTLIGTGVLSWRPLERVSDRYGTVGLIPDGVNSLNSHPENPWLTLERTSGHGQLVAKVIETRQSTHIGDLFRGLRPERPEVGAEILLGEGELFYEKDWVGLRPDEERDFDWLDPGALYQVHEQTVELIFRTKEE